MEPQHAFDDRIAARFRYSISLPNSWIQNPCEQYDPASQGPNFRSPKLQGTVGENLARWSDHGSKTPLIISHTFGSALAYIQAATESHILPNEPSTMLHMSLNTLLLTPSATPASPPQAGNSSLGRHPWVEGSPPGSFLLAAAAGGFTNRIFQVSPAPENRDSVEYDSGEVHYQHRPRQEAVTASCSLHLNASNMLEISQGTDIACCHGCKVRQRAGGTGDVEVAAPGGRVEGGNPGGGGWNESVDQGGFLSGFGRAVEEGSGESGGDDAAARPVRFQSWRGELADASKPEEVDFDADELINAIMPIGSYVLSIGMSFFARSSERRLAEECRWLTDKPVATRCVLPLSKTPPGTPVSVAYPIAVSNLITAALSTHSAPEELPRDCLSAYGAFRTYMWSATSRNRFASFVKHHPFEAAGELCTPSKWRSRTGHREETMQALWVKRRVETVRRFLLAIKRNLRPPSMILVATSDEPFELPMPRSRWLSTLDPRP
jgi:hypothetical protein